MADSFTSNDEKFTQKADGWQKQTEKIPQYQEAKNKSEQAHSELDRHLESSHKRRKTRTIYKQERYFDTETGKAGYAEAKEEVPVDNTHSSPFFVRKTVNTLKAKIANEVSKAEQHDTALEATHKTSKQVFKMSKGLKDWHKEDTRLKQENKDAVFKIAARKADWDLAGVQAKVEYFNDMNAPSENSQNPQNPKPQNADKKQIKKRQQEIFDKTWSPSLKEPVIPVITENMSKEEIAALTKLYQSQVKEHKAIRKLDKLCEPKIQRRKSLIEVGAAGLGIQGQQFLLNSMERSDNSALEATAKSFRLTSSATSNAKKFIQNQRSHQINKLRFESTKAGAQQSVYKKSIKNAQKKAAQKKMQQKRNHSFFEYIKPSKAEKAKVVSFFKKGIGKYILIAIAVILIIILIIAGLFIAAGSMTTILPATIVDVCTEWFVGNDNDLTDEKIAEMYDKSQKQIVNVIHTQTVPDINNQLNMLNSLSRTEFHEVRAYASDVTQDDPIVNQILIALATKRFIDSKTDVFNEESINLKFTNNEIYKLSREFWKVKSEKHTPYYCPGNNCRTRTAYVPVQHPDGTVTLVPSGTEAYCDGHHVIEYFWAERTNPLQSIFPTNDQREIYNFIADFLYGSKIIDTEEEIPLLPDETTTTDTESTK